MTKRQVYIFIIVTLAWLSACSKGDRLPELSDGHLTEAVLCKDSALAYYSQIDSMLAMTDDDRARYVMLKLLVGYYTNHRQTSDSLMMDVEEHFKNSRGLDNTLSLICVGLAYEQMGEEGKALPCYVSAASQLDGTGHDRLSCVVYARWGWLLKTEPPYTESLVKLDKAEGFARSLQDTCRLSRILGMKGWCFLFSHRYDKAHQMFDDGIALSRAHRCDDLAWLLKSKASAYEMQGNHLMALRFANEAIAHSDHEDRSLTGIKGTCFIGLGRYDSARIYIDKGRLDERYYQKASYYSEMAALEESQKHYEKALDNYKRYSLYVDSQYDEDRRLALAQSEKRYNYALVAADRDRYALENQRKTALLVALVAVMLSVAVGAFYIHQRYRRRVQDALRMKEKLLSQSLEQIKDRNYQLMKTKQEAQDKEMELMTTLTYKDEQLAQLRQQQRELKDTILHNNDVIMKIEALNKMNEKNKISSAQTIALTSDERQNLIESTNLCYDNFVDRLKLRFEDLSQDDICLCCLLKLGINAQDQSILLHTSDSTLRTRKYRLKKKKMQLTDDFETLDDFIKVF